jgi:hypothetical protein
LLVLNWVVRIRFADNFKQEAKVKEGEGIYTPGIKLKGLEKLHIAVGSAFKIKFNYKNLLGNNSPFGIPGICVLKYTKVE